MAREPSSTRRGYGIRYQRARAAILGPAGNGDLLHDVPCHWRDPGCTGIATTADHEPPLEVCGFHHLQLVPACAHCNYGRRRRTVKEQPRIETFPSRCW